MLRFIMYMIATAAIVYTASMAIRFGLRLAFSWDDRISGRIRNRHTGFRWYYRIPTSTGVIPEFFFFLVLGRKNYFRDGWWALRTSFFISLLLFLVAVLDRSAVEKYYSLAYLAENGFTAYLSSGAAFWYLNMVNLLFLGVFILLLVESIRMHHGWSPVRIIIYTVLCVLMVLVTLAVLILIIAVSFLYLAYRIIKFLMSSRRTGKRGNDGRNEKLGKLSKMYGEFMAELYAWESERRSAPKAKPMKRKPRITRKKKNDDTKPAPIDNDIPRFHPD